MRSARKPPSAGELHVWRVELAAGAWGVPPPGAGDRDAPRPDDGVRGDRPPADGGRGAPRPDDGVRDAPRPRDGDRGAPRPDDGVRGAPRPDDGVRGDRPPAADARRRARGALATILAEYLGGGAKDAPDIVAVEPAAGEGGKPRLALAPERLSFNLSHSGDLALIAIAPGGVEVGVDVERLRPRRDLARLAERWLPTADAAAVAGAGEADREAAFYAAWTRHEARVKCTGAGLDGPAPGPEVVAHQLPIDAGYAAAVAVDTRATGVTKPRVTLETWKPG